MVKIFFKSLFFLMLLFSACELSAQDLIITSKGDSLNCKIHSVKKEKVYLTFKHMDEIRTIYIPKSNIVEMKYGFYSVAIVPAARLVVKENYSKWRFAVDGGFFNRTGAIPAGLSTSQQNYIKDIKSGSGISLGVQYFTSENLGFGWLFNHYNSSASLPGFSMQDADGTYISGLLTENVSIDFNGPVYYTRFYDIKKKNALVTGLGLGYVGYLDQSSVGNLNFDLTGGTFGMYLSLGYDIKLSKSLDLGLKIALVGGTLTQYDFVYQNYRETVYLDENSYENLGHFDFTIGLRLNK